LGEKGVQRFVHTLHGKEEMGVISRFAQ
jgi:hypothetical protein